MPTVLERFEDWRLPSEECVVNLWKKRIPLRLERPGYPGARKETMSKQPNNAEHSGSTDDSPFSLCCILCDTGMDIDDRLMAERYGWTEIEEDADGLGHNHTGICPQCHADDLGVPVEFGVLLVQKDKTSYGDAIRWRDWNEAAQFGEHEVKSGRAIGFRIFHEAAV